MLKFVELMSTENRRDLYRLIQIFIDNPDVQNEFYITLCCAKFNSLREKYIKPYYYRRPSVLKFVELMSTENRRDLYRDLYRHLVFDNNMVLCISLLAN